MKAFRGSSFISRRVGFPINSRRIVLSISFRWIVAGISTRYSNRGCDVFLSRLLCSPSSLFSDPEEAPFPFDADPERKIQRTASAVQLAGERQNRLDMAITDAVF